MASIKNIAATLFTTLLISNIEVNGMSMAEKQMNPEWLFNSQKFDETMNLPYNTTYHNIFFQQYFCELLKYFVNYPNNIKLDSNNLPNKNYSNNLTYCTNNQTNNINDSQVKDIDNAEISKASDKLTELQNNTNDNNNNEESDNAKIAKESNKLTELQNNTDNKNNNITNNRELTYKDLINFNDKTLLPILEKYWNNLVTHNGKDKINFKPSVTFFNESINSYDTTINKQELKEFQEILKNSKDDKDITFNQYIKDIYYQILSNYYYNVKKFQFTTGNADFHFFNYFYAIENSIKNLLKTNNIKDIQHKIITDDKNNNALLSKIAELYIEHKFNTLDEKKIEEFLSKNNDKFNIYSLVNEFLNFYTIGFDDILNQIIKFTLKIKNQLSLVVTNKNNLNNKVLQTVYDCGKLPNTILQLKFENYNLGVCWFNTAFETVYTIALNSNIGNDTTFKQFVKHLQTAQFNKIKLVKNSNATKQYGNYCYKMTEQINLLKELNNFIENMKISNTAQYNEWMDTINSNELSKKALEEINTLIKEDAEAEKRLQHNLAQGINKITSTHHGNNSSYGISLLCNIFPELKPLFEIKYDKTIEKNSKETIQDYYCNNLSTPIANIFPVEYTKKYGNKITMAWIPHNESANTVTDKMQPFNIKHIKEFPEYIILDTNKQNNIEDTIVRITENGELLIYKLSNLAKNKVGMNHAYAVYFNADGAQLMDDHNNYHTSYNNKDPIELAIYKQVYKCKLQKQEDKK